jgi:hypothetical protein
MYQLASWLAGSIMDKHVSNRDIFCEKMMTLLLFGDESLASFQSHPIELSFSTLIIHSLVFPPQRVVVGLSCHYTK